jgi:hypothetical protein
MLVVSTCFMTVYFFIPNMIWSILVSDGNMCIIILKILFLVILNKLKVISIFGHSINFFELNQGIGESQLMIEIEITWT